jgi:hypothetical protein
VSALIYKSAPGVSVLTRLAYIDMAPEDRARLLRTIRRHFGRRSGVHIDGERCAVARTDRYGTHVEGYISRAWSEVQS